jgi:hypothetical protein
MERKEYKNSGWARHLTPPDSPLPFLRTVLGSSSLDDTSGKMSLDFIAPGCRARSPTSPNSTFPTSTQSPFFTVGELAPIDLPEVSVHNKDGPLSNTPAANETCARSDKRHNPVSGLPSPVWSSCSDISLPQPSSLDQKQRPNNNYHWQHQDQLQQPLSTNSTYTAPPQTSKGTKLSRRSSPSQNQLPPRPERHLYDSEECYAIIHLRAVLGLKWEEVLKKFSRLFPVGQQRRCKVNLAPGMPHTYQARNVGGLQCKWYRIREEENLRPLRRGEMVDGGLGSEEAQVLERMAGEGVCGEEFLREFR